MAKIICSEEDIIQTREFHARLWQLIKSIEDHEVFYKYPQADKLIQTLLIPRFLRADITTNDRGLIYVLYGDYHTGKSHLLTYFCTLMERCYPELWQKYELPIMQIDLNNHINTATQFLLFLLDKLGRPIDPRIVNSWNKEGLAKERLQQRVIALFEQLGTRMLILDECQRLLVARNPDLRDIFELLKDLCTKKNWSGNLRTQIVLCGTNDGIPLLEAADWIQGRTRILRLFELNVADFGALLIDLYRDYVTLGISREWTLMMPSNESTKYTLNSDLAAYLYTRTQGKVGLVVDLIRNAVLFALDNGRLFPEKNDYESIQLNQKLYLMNTEVVPKIDNSKEFKPKIHLTLRDRACQVENCPRMKTPFKRYSALVYHYQKNHTGIDFDYEVPK